jgi:hypothetical protein
MGEAGAAAATQALPRARRSVRDPGGVAVKRLPDEKLMSGGGGDDRAEAENGLPGDPLRYRSAEHQRRDARWSGATDSAWRAGSGRRPVSPGLRRGIGWCGADRRSETAATVRRRSPGGATARPSGEPLAFAATAHGCRGHGWAGFRAGASLRACFGLRSARRSRASGRRSAAATVARRCDRAAVRRTLGVRRDGPRLSGPWMARQP